MHTTRVQKPVEKNSLEGGFEVPQAKVSQRNKVVMDCMSSLQPYKDVFEAMSTESLV